MLVNPLRNEFRTPDMDGKTPNQSASTPLGHAIFVIQPLGRSTLKGLPCGVKGDRGAADPDKLADDERFG
jgi:hypothetical protein